MDYLVAQDLIRSEHLDLVREGGLNGFKPFETTCGAATEPLIRLSPAEPLTLDDFAGYRELDRFDFDEAVADCHFGRYDGGRLFYPGNDRCSSPKPTATRSCGATSQPTAAPTPRCCDSDCG